LYLTDGLERAKARELWIEMNEVVVLMFGEKRKIDAQPAQQHAQLSGELR
jgi:hypothetical protein